MLSILIPVYNFDVEKLVRKLHQQGMNLTVDFEIILVDDASTDNCHLINNTLQALEYVQYIGLEQNKGRSRIRNYLATLAQYEYLLYMDCDSMPTSNHFLSNYVAELNANQLLYGGRVYDLEKPTAIAKILHWSYGTNREVVERAVRQENPYRSFMTNNFLIPKHLMVTHPFDESIREYGHEDTLFGIELEKSKVAIKHINNPLEHIDVETADSFLHKTEQALANLCQLSQQYNLEGHIKILDFYFRCKRLYLVGAIRVISKILIPIIRRNLYSKNPNLRLFDLYRLCILIQKMPR
jgi:glycosyltransferase involved in cell wall biosynthesis